MTGLERSFQAVVTDIRMERRVAGGAQWQVSLDRTEFSPEVLGRMEAVARSGARLVVPVLRVDVDAAGEVWHLVEKPLAAGTEIVGRLERPAEL